MSGLPEEIEAVEAAWAMGGRAREAAAPGWLEAIGPAEGDEAELRLLALAGQAVRVGLRPAPSEGAAFRPDLPALELPPLPDALRPRFRAATEGPAPDLVLDLLAARGWAAHPLDWMPRAAGPVPALYAPWQDWLARAGPAPEALTAEVWDDLTAAPRRRLFEAARADDPDRARALLEAKLAALPAEERVGLVEALGTGLSRADAPFLRGLSTDRSARVRTMAALLLARLEPSETGGTDAEAVRAVFLSRRTGLIRKRTVFGAVEVKPSVLRRRLLEIEGATLYGIAAALGTEPLDLVREWDWGAVPDADATLAGVIARTGGTEAVHDPALPLTGPVAAALAPRLSPEGWARRRDALLAAEPEPGIGAVPLLAAVPPASRGLGTLSDPSGKLLAWLRDSDPADAAQARLADDALAFLGLICDRAAAASILAAMERTGRGLADPSLALLRLNAALLPSDREG